MCKKSSVRKRSKIVNSLRRIATSTANTLTAITSSLIVQVEVLRYLVPIYSIYSSFVCSLFPSQRYRAYLRGGLIRGVEHASREVWAYLPGRGLIGGEIRYTQCFLYLLFQVCLASCSHRVLIYI